MMDNRRYKGRKSCPNRLKLWLKTRTCHWWARNTVSETGLALCTLPLLWCDRSPLPCLFHNAVYSQYISRSCISRNWIYRGRMLDPIFWRTRGRNHSNSLDPVRGRQFLAKSAHRDCLCSQFAEDNFSRNQLKPTCQCGLEPHAVRWSAMLGGALTPSLCWRVGSSSSCVNVNRNYKSLIWA